MGLSSLPAPSEGILCVLLVNTAFSISIFKGIIRAILDLIGLRLRWQPSSSSLDSLDDYPQPQTPLQRKTEPSESYMDLFRARTQTIRFDDVICDCPEECSVCLTEFIPESEMIVLSCGHVFHGKCLEKWIVYWNITCPLCRAPFLPEEGSSFSFLLTTGDSMESILLLE